MGRAARRSRDTFTWHDYRSWPEDERWELVAGRAYAMSPAPSVEHQQILLELGGELRSFFAGRTCSVLPAPTNLKLSEEDVVQPDLLVYCDPRQNRGTHIEGPPALVVEIVSPSSQQHDRMRKLLLYARHGIGEYWIVSPRDQILEVLVLKDAAYSIAHVLGPDDELVSPAFGSMSIPLRKIFVTPPHPDQVRETEPPGYPADAERTEHV